MTIYDEYDDEIYYWQTEDSPTLQFSGVSQPSFLNVTLENEMNGAFTYIDFFVTTSGGLSDGDKVIVKLPFGWQFSRLAEVYGLVESLNNVMSEVVISVDQRQIDITMELASRRMLKDEILHGRDLQISSGLSYEFRITQMLNA